MDRMDLMDAMDGMDKRILQSVHSVSEIGSLVWFCEWRVIAPLFILRAKRAYSSPAITLKKQDSPIGASIVCSASVDERRVHFSGLVAASTTGVPPSSV